ncbi:MAG: Asp/Glu racemase [Pseudomonadota bacterium]
MKIACLHTLEANAALFDAARPEGVELIHATREDLLRRAIERGEADEEIIEETAAALKALAAESGADGVLLTCTTIAPGAARAGATRVDAALAEAAAAKAGPGGVVDALITIPTTREATRGVFEAAAAPVGATVRVVMVEGALEAFQARDLDRYARIVADAADKSTGDVVALAQASMAPAAAMTTREAMTSPKAGLDAVIKVAAARG